MEKSLKYAIILLIAIIVIWYIMKSREHFEQCSGVDKNMDYKFEENKDRTCNDNCGCTNSRVCNKGKCVTA
jgi:hypothetical protein